MKQKKYAAAYASFKEILDMYAATTPGVLPGAYNKLAEIGMNRIPKHRLPETKPSKVRTNTETKNTSSEAANGTQNAEQKMQDTDVRESQVDEAETQSAK